VAGKPATYGALAMYLKKIFFIFFYLAERGLAGLSLIANAKRPLLVLVRIKWVMSELYNFADVYQIHVYNFLNWR